MRLLRQWQRLRPSALAAGLLLLFTLYLVYPTHKSLHPRNSELLWPAESDEAPKDVLELLLNEPVDAVARVLNVPRQPTADVNTLDSKSWPAGQYTFEKEKRKYLKLEGFDREQKLLVILAPHSHCDPGWLKTYENYQKEDVNKALDGMLRFLAENPDMTFQWSETSFLQPWWDQLTDADKALFKQLVSTGRVELTYSAWTMTDEASTHYTATIDNIIEGHQFIAANLDNYAVTTSWNNDPFGYGPTLAFLLRKSGVRMHVLSRVPLADKAAMFDRALMPFHWRQLFGADSDAHSLFTHVLPSFAYTIRHTCGFDMQVCCQFDFRGLTEPAYCSAGVHAITPANVAERSATILQQWRSLAAAYHKTSNNVILVPLGDDFRYLTDREWHQQHDNYAALAAHINGNASYNTEMRFGTLSTYYEALVARRSAVAKSRSEPQQPWRTLAGDFFPYTEHGSDWWTGYFTSRPFYKKRGQQLNAMVRATDSLYNWWLSLPAAAKPAELSSRVLTELAAARRNLALFQHHDAITGTSKQFVMKDYGLRLLNSLHVCERLQSVLLQQLLSANSFLPAEGQIASYVHFPDLDSEKKNKVPAEADLPPLDIGTRRIYVYNSLPTVRHELITVRSRSPYVSVWHLASNGKRESVPAQVQPSVADPATYEVKLLCVLYPLSVGVYEVHVHNKPTADDSPLATIHMHDCGQNAVKPFTCAPLTAAAGDGGLLQVRLGDHELRLNATTGFVKAMDGQPFEVDFGNYVGSGSGAYVFDTIAQTPAPLPLQPMRVWALAGPLWCCVHSESALLTHSLCLTKSVTSEWQLSIDNRLDLNRIPPGSRSASYNVVMRLRTPVTNAAGAFYTDNMGYQMLRRSNDRGVAHSVSPLAVSVAVAVQGDNGRRLTLHTDYAHGALLSQSQHLDIMLDRFSERDDGKGLGGDQQSLMNDPAPIWSHFELLLEPVAMAQTESPSQSAATEYIQHLGLNSWVRRQRLLSPPLVFVDRPTLTKPAQQQPQQQQPQQQQPQQQQQQKQQRQPYPVVDTWPTKLAQPRLGERKLMSVLLDGDREAEDRWQLSQADALLWPCDYELVTLRPTSENERVWLLVLQRLALDARLPYTQAQTTCSTRADIKDSLVRLLRALHFGSVQQTTLNGVTNLTEPVDLAHLSLDMQLMDLNTFRLTRP